MEGFFLFSSPFLFLVFSLSTIDRQTRCLFLFLLLPRSLIIPSHCSSFSSSSTHFSCLSNIPVFFLIFSFSLQGSHSLIIPSCFPSSFLFLFFYRFYHYLHRSAFYFVFPPTFCIHPALPCFLICFPSFLFFLYYLVFLLPASSLFLSLCVRDKSFHCCCLDSFGICQISAMFVVFGALRLFC